ncbi:MAG TPA: hypothetical protein VL793_01360, partial [Patescibacteria group bacterium]|nr:hypothetical protein [Patescibacteria group bacterium]
MTAIALMAGVAALLLLGRTSKGKDDRAHRQNWQHYGNLASYLNRIEHLLGGDIASLLRVQKLERIYEAKGNGEMEALIESGYLVRMPFSITNLGKIQDEVMRQWFSLPDGGERNEGVWIFNDKSNVLTIICRPEYASAFGELYAWHS